jgi:hypothetical protein
MLEWVSERLLALIEQLAVISRDRRDYRDNALRAVSHALTETCLYYRNLERTGRHPDIEAQLSKYWSAAAIPIRHLDVELAEVCDRKSEYWINPRNYQLEDIRRLGIGLEAVREEYRSLLKYRIGTPLRRRSIESE